MCEREAEDIEAQSRLSSPVPASKKSQNTQK
jgi:hypothetical protein